MLHLIYILAFTVLAFLAVGNLIRNLMTLGIESQRAYAPSGRFSPNSDGLHPHSGYGRSLPVTHPELLDEHGNMVSEPLLVMRSFTVEDAREQLDALYNSSPSKSDEAHGEV